MKNRRFTTLYPKLAVLVDYLLLNFFFLFIHFFLYSAFRIPYESSLKLPLFFLNISFLPFALYLSSFHRKFIIFSEQLISTSFLVITGHFVVLTTLFYFLNDVELSRNFLLIFYSLLFVAFPLFWFWERYLLKRYRLAGHNLRKVVIVGGGGNGMALAREFIENPTYGVVVLGFFDDTVRKADCKYPLDCLGKVDEIHRFIESNEVDEVYCTLPPTASEKIIPIIQLCDKFFIRYYFIPGYFRYLKRKIEISYLGLLPLMRIKHEPLDDFINNALKRSFDILFSLIALIIIFPPLFLFVKIVYMFSSPGPVIFKQKRTGLHGKEFTCYKFRSMHVNDLSDSLQATDGDPRITVIGNILRRCSLDEIPQFYNVLKGDMSVVGPRPHMLKHTEEYSLLIDKYMIRHTVKPGITGLAQVSGFRGETKELWQMERRVELDVAYIETWSLSLDIRIIIQTVVNGLMGDKNAV